MTSKKSVWYYVTSCKETPWVTDVHEEYVKFLNDNCTLVDEGMWVDRDGDKVFEGALLAESKEDAVEDIMGYW